ncbi:uncharacterized protein EV154DRAFT_270026 [Mucor mucedo]|uniref:uncharacterized protein n=1 Tax=Mucor mucedo TaxID=29922 RepID=UPI00221FBE99|nr:uncharacterized protein EV154DRAFT_270026 [Mucor mucedo]KAI7889803.1 hypothetical protein EV154DRAFT_270026 [Mucor mucedo]
MEEHDNIVKSLNNDFKNVDRAYQTSEMRVFGKNTGQIFRELDVIRRKQIDLASDHVSLEAINDIQPPHLVKQPHSANKNFEKKEAVLKSMMEKGSL